MPNPSKNTKVVIAYNDVFPEEPKEDISNLLQNIPSKQSLQIIAHFSARLHANENNNKIHVEALIQWLGRLSNKVKENLINATTPHIQRGNYLFINQPSCLYLIQSILTNFNDLESRKLTPEDELNLFKAYLIASEWSVKNSEKIQQTGIKNLEDFVDVSLLTQFPISDVKNSREFYIQAYKAILLFEFFESKEGFKDILADFIESTSLKNWVEYLTSILKIYTYSLMDLENGNKSLVKFEQANEVSDFLDNLTLNPHKFEAKKDFISIREKPVIKLDKDEYLFLNIDLFLDKLFGGILFDIYSSVSKNEYDDVDVNDFRNFKSAIGQEFTEETLFYEVINYIKQDQWVSYSGKELKEKIDGEPDFYLRRRSKVFLFECKDTLISSRSKNSDDVNQIKSEISEKLIRGTKNKKKGVSQLLSFASDLNEVKVNQIDNFDIQNAKYYPIIVVTDKTLDEFGINYLFSANFEKLLKEFELENLRFQQPIVVQLDDLIKFADLFKEEKLKLNSIFDSYISWLNSEDKFIQTASFGNFLKIQATKYNQDPSKLVDKKLESIFNK